MNLIQLRNEVLARGFDANTYGARITQFLNDGQNLVARRVNYYVNESFELITTVGGTSTYPFPADFARIRELFATDLQTQLQPVGLRQIDRSVTTSGRPYFYALDGANIHLYPTPDVGYPLKLRYWAMPTALVNDTDTPNIPQVWLKFLCAYAKWQCFEADEDAAMGQYWQTRFNQDLAEFEADQKFISTEFPWIAEGMWGDGETLSPSGNTWTLYGGYGGY